MTTFPKTVYILRHAEKPSDPTDPHLSAEGLRRAYDLKRLFGFQGRLAGVQYLFAADRSKHSNRCVETLQPLSEALHLSLNHDFEDDEWRDLAKRIKSGKKYAGATILACWHHENLPNLAKALGVPAGSLPWKKWPDDCFDVVWVLDFVPAGLVGVHGELQEVEG